MKNKSYVLGGLLIVIVSGIFLFLGRGPSFVEIQEQTEPILDEEELRKSYPRGDIRMPSASPSTISSNDLKEFQKAYPEQQDVKAEVEKNPHGTPESIINFAKMMGPLMDKALMSGDEAKVLMSVLHECALNNSVAQVARALCLSNAEKLGKNHPQMKDKADQIRANVSPEVNKLLDKKNLLIKK